MDADLKRLFSLFFDGEPKLLRTVDTSRGEDDHRETFIVETEDGERYVIKLADNDFTFPERIAVWERTVEEYRRLGHYCPRILRDRSGGFPKVEHGGRLCTAYAEEFAPYRSAEDRLAEDGERDKTLYDSYKNDVWRMTARVAAKHFDYTEYPSAYCLFETFCPSDKTDEVLENALAWKEYADTLPGEFGRQTERIFGLWTENRAALAEVYPALPTSVFQADLNPTNVLLDDDGRFVGVYDFNLCGRDVFLNYLMRENFGEFDKELAMIREALTISSGYYRFSDIEKDSALMLYRCLKPLSFISVETLKEAGADHAAIKAVLDETEYYLTADIDFKKYMEGTGVSPAVPAAGGASENGSEMERNDR